MSSVGRLRAALIARLQRARLSYGQGTANAGQEALAILAHVSGRTFAELLASPTAQLTAEQAAHAVALTKQRIQSGDPLPYLTGEAWLMGHRFLVERGTLIPRSLIAEWLVRESKALQSWNPSQVLDLCCGGGSIGIIAAHCLPQARLSFSDIEPQALALTRRNLRLHRLTPRARVRQSDLLAGWSATSDAHPPAHARLAPAQFDLILCNPPYVNAEAMEHLPPAFQREPRSALAGGNDGMDLIEPLLQQAGRCLTETGVIVIEIGHEAAHFEHRFPALECAWLPVTAGDQMVVAIARGALRRGLEARKRKRT